MRIGVVLGVLLAFAAAGSGWAESGKDAKPETLARWHFVGTKQLANAKGIDAIRDILALKESADLRDVAVEGIAMQLAGHFTKTNATNVNAQIAALIKPLLPDLLQNESRFELSARGADDADWVLSFKLPADRTAEWARSLSNLAVAAHMTVSGNEKGNGLSAQREKYRFTFEPGAEWTVLQCGFGPSSLGARKSPKSGKEVFSGELNGPAIAKVWSAERFQHAPKLSLQVEPRKDGLRSEMLIDYPQALNIKPERWNVPSDLIHDPLVGFTAIQGIAHALEQNQEFKRLGAEKTPNQLFLWSQGLTVFTVFGAADVGNPGTVVSNLVATVLPKLRGIGGSFAVLTNRPAILWRDLPVVTPFVEAANDGQSPFLVGGLFPVTQAKPKPAPAELLAQLKKRNLIYYDWEITQDRLKQWRPIWQAVQIIHGNSFNVSPSDRWIEAITPKLGNTITEGTLEGPSRIKLVRQSQSGFSALELALLAHALDPYDIRERHALPPGQQPQQRRSKPAPVPIAPAPQRVQPAK